MARPRRRWRVVGWLVAFGIAGCTYLASVFTHVTFYSQRLTATLQCGSLGLYWGGPSGVRNAWVHNGFSGPWDGSGAGADAPEGLVYYIRTLDEFCSNSATDWRYVLGGVLPRCGANDRLIREYTFEELVVPFWIPLAVLGAGVAYVLIRSRRLHEGLCRRCGYNLTGNVTGTCPECGAWVGEQAA
jgi:hypothetical protein